MFRAGLLAARAPTVALKYASAVPKQNFQQIRAFRGRVNAAKAVPFKTGISLPKGYGAMKAGELAVGGGALLGLGSLCYYGLGLASEPGAIDKFGVWHPIVRERIRDTYAYLGASLALVAGSAVTVFRSPQGQKLLHLTEKHPLASTVGIIAAMLGTGIAMFSVPYQPGTVSAKHLLWASNAAVLGLAIAPIGFLGGALAMRAAWYTAGIVGGLSTVAVCAPSDRFLAWGGPLSIGLGVVFCSSLAGLVVPPTGALGLGIHSIVLYGGLLLFSAYLLYDTQRVIKKAETHPSDGQHWDGYQWVANRPFDPINASHHIVLDVLNIFIRVAQMLAMSKGGRRK